MNQHWARGRSQNNVFCTEEGPDEKNVWRNVLFRKNLKGVIKLWMALRWKYCLYMYKLQGDTSAPWGVVMMPSSACSTVEYEGFLSGAAYCTSLF